MDEIAAHGEVDYETIILQGDISLLQYSEEEPEFNQFYVVIT